MARVRYIGAEPVTVPELGNRTIEPDELVEVPDERYDGYVCQPTAWEAVEEPRDEAPPVVAPKKLSVAAKAVPTSKEG
ncbi:hypothetical protein ABZ371_00720 [Streptomyces sp. NPDC005899]|uniref:hypothetical protein n=1 Tax=Streptomyces sp. NPDC005899 TaxID=3155716 RepID=UPI0033CFA7BF